MAPRRSADRPRRGASAWIHGESCSSHSDDDDSDDEYEGEAEEVRDERAAGDPSSDADHRAVEASRAYRDREAGDGPTFGRRSPE